MSQHPQQILRFSTVDSTNLEAWRHISKGNASSGMVFLADYQTQGKGQAGAFWESEAKKNLLFSLVYKSLPLPPSKQFMLTKVVSVSLCQTLTSILPNQDIKIKWPNDIYAGLKKIAGILIENSIMAEQIEYTVIGIGINVNQKQFLSEAPNPISFSQLTGIAFERDDLLNKCLRAIQEGINDLYKGKFYDIDQQYLDMLWGYKQILSFTDHTRYFEARIAGINEFGKLILEEKGVKTLYDMKELSFVLE